MAFTDLDGDGPGVSSLTNRYLNGPEVDQVFFDEQLNANGSFKDLFEPLADHLGTIRDIAKRNANGTTSIVNHIRYDSFGNILSESNAAVDHIFGFTGQIWDADALLWDFNRRWYDPVIGRFISEDPIGLDGGYTNFYVYVGNNPTNLTDPTGLWPAGGSSSQGYRPPNAWRQPPSQRPDPWSANGQSHASNPGASGARPPSTWSGVENGSVPYFLPDLPPEEIARRSQEILRDRALRRARQAAHAASETVRRQNDCPPPANTYTSVTVPWQRQVNQRSDIDWNFVRPHGTPAAGHTNREAARMGYTPVRINPQTGRTDDVVLHHLLDNPRGGVVEVWRSDHTRFHQMVGRAPNPWRQERPDWARAWNNEQSAYWRWRTGAYDPPRTDRLRLPGDEYGPSP